MHMKDFFNKKNLLGIAGIGGFIYVLALLLNFLQGTI